MSLTLNSEICVTVFQPLLRGYISNNIFLKQLTAARLAGKFEMETAYTAADMVTGETDTSLD